MKFELELEAGVVEMFLFENKYYKTRCNESVKIPKLTDANPTEIEDLRKFFENCIVELAYESYSRMMYAEEERGEFLAKLAA